MTSLDKTWLGVTLALIAAYAVAGWGLAFWLGVPEQFTPLLYSGTMVHVTVILFLLFLGWRVWSLILFDRPAHLTVTLINDVRARLFTRAQVVAAVPLILGFMVFMSAFTSIKGLIPLVQPYTWDPVFMQADRVLHGGVDPWRILMPVFGGGFVTGVLNVVYNLWYVVMFAVLYWQLLDLRRPALRRRFFTVFFLGWAINGTVLAMVFSSAGPCFYGVVTELADHPFVEQMTRLRDLSAAGYPVWAVQTQDALWQAYQNNRTGLGSGIAAMPSVHVAMAVLFAVLGLYYNRWVKYGLIAFAVLIMIGSVHLAWHYAVDGYLGAVVVLALWWASGFLPGNRNKT